MITRCILTEDLSNAALSTYFPERRIDISLTHNDAEGAIQRLCFRFCPQNPPRPIQLSLIQLQVLMSYRCSLHSIPPSMMFIILELMNLGKLARILLQSKWLQARPAKSPALGQAERRGRDGCDDEIFRVKQGIGRAWNRAKRWNPSIDSGQGFGTIGTFSGWSTKKRRKTILTSFARSSKSQRKFSSSTPTISALQRKRTAS